MKMFGYYFLFAIMVVIIIPLIIVKGCEGLPEEHIELKKGTKIKVVFHETGEIKTLYLDEYIAGVVVAEMPASYSEEALKAQAVTARTYAFNKIISGGKNIPIHNGADICTDSTHCQAWIDKNKAQKNWAKANAKNAKLYWGKISRAVSDTSGELIYYNNKLANPLFHANSGGRTENSEDVWDGVGAPYLKSVVSPGEENSSGYLSKADFSVDEFIKLIKKEYPDIKINKSKIVDQIKIIEYSIGGRVKKIEIGNKSIRGTELRKILNLKSTCFKIEVSSAKIIFEVKGYGHGVGMSQAGADAMAKKGANYQEILKHYYQGVEIKKSK